MLRTVALLPAALMLAANLAAQCDPANGGRFNLEPRPNAVVQVARSVAFLPNRAGPGLDLVVTTGTDARNLLGSPDAFYASRSNASCAPDFEGVAPTISNVFDLFLPFGSSTVIADPARDAFFMVDLRFGLDTDDEGVGIIRATATNLLSSTACPDGTQQGSASCWTVGAVTNITQLNEFLDQPHIAVDPRASGSGTGAGDLYTVVSQVAESTSNHHISLTACTNARLVCSSSVAISGADANADFPYVQVRPDGVVTVSYRNTVFPGIHPEDIKFVVCRPNGAPNPPTCAPPVLVTTEMTPISFGLIGDVPMTDSLFPRHLHRLESDGHTITTFLLYDRCNVAEIPQRGAAQAFCPKTEVAYTTSTDGGQTWSPVSAVSNAPGQQFFGAAALDASTSTVNIAYYSTENDFFQQKPQVFLAQIPSGSTTAEPSQLLTTGAADVRASSPIVVFLQPAGFGDRLAIAAAGTGSPGASRAYVGFTWNTIPGTYGGVSSADVNNHLTDFTY
jgi:hypothetical protein